MPCNYFGLGLRIYFELSEMEFDTFESLLGPVSKFPLPVKLIHMVCAGLSHDGVRGQEIQKLNS